MRVTASRALWWVRKIGSAFLLMWLVLGSLGWISRTKPIWAMARDRAAGVGGARFERSPGMPTALTE